MQNYNFEGTQETAEQKSFLSKNRIAITLIIAVIVCAAIVIAAVSLRSSPLETVKKAADNSMEEAKKSEIYQTASDVLSGGSMEISANLSGILEELIGIGMDGEINISVFPDASQKKLVVTADSKIEGSDFIDFTAFLGTDRVTFSSETLFDNKTYGFSSENLAENFKKSGLSKDGGDDIGLGLGEAEIGNIEKFLDLMKDVEGLEKEYEVLGEKLSEKLMALFTEYADIRKSSGKLTVAGKEIKTTDVTVSADEKMLASIAAELLDYLSSEKDFTDLYSKFAALLYPDNGEDAGNIEKSLSDLKKEAEDYFNGLDNVLVKGVFHIKGRELIGIDAEIKEKDDVLVSASAVVAPTWKDPEEISFSLKNTDGTMAVSYTEETDTDKEYSAKLIMTENDETIVSAAFSWNRESGSFSIRADIEGEELTLNANVKEDEKTIIIDSVSIDTDGEEIDLSDFRAVIRYASSMPAVEENYTDIFSMDEEEIEEFKNTADEMLMALAMRMLLQ